MMSQQSSIDESRRRITSVLILQSVCFGIFYIATFAIVQNSVKENALCFAAIAISLTAVLALLVERSFWRLILDPMIRSASSVIYLTQNTGHELATAVAILKSRLQVIERQATESISTEDLTTLIDATERASSLVNDLRFLLRSDAFECRRHLSMIYLDGLISSCVNRFQRELKSRSLMVELDLTSCCMVGDPELIDRLISNLLKNGVDHIRPDARIAIKLRKVENRIILTFEDDGEGIPEHARNSIFDRAFSLRTTIDSDERTMNSGLGLAIAKSIVEAHHGKISLVNNTSQGCHFRIEFPSSPVSHPFSNLILK